jgi:hypothetical protein
MDAATSIHRELMDMHREFIKSMKRSQERSDWHGFQCDKYRAEGIQLALIAVQMRMGVVGEVA